MTRLEFDFPLRARLRVHALFGPLYSSPVPPSLMQCTFGSFHVSSSYLLYLRNAIGKLPFRSKRWLEESRVSYSCCVHCAYMWMWHWSSELVKFANRSRWMHSVGSPSIFLFSLSLYLSLLICTQYDTISPFHSYFTSFYRYFVRACAYFSFSDFFLHWKLVTFRSLASSKFMNLPCEKRIYIHTHKKNVPNDASKPWRAYLLWWMLAFLVTRKQNRFQTILLLLLVALDSNKTSVWKIWKRCKFHKVLR